MKNSGTKSPAKYLRVIAGLAFLAGVGQQAKSAETLVMPYTQEWRFMNPMGNSPTLNDPDFDNTWWLPEGAFSTDYNGPAFGVPQAGNPAVPSSINSGTSPGPVGYGEWAPLEPLLYPFGGGDPIVTFSTNPAWPMTRPNSGRRYASYHRTVFSTSSALSNPKIRCIIDDGAVIFLDGVQVARVNLSLASPEALPSYFTLAQGDGTLLPNQQPTKDTLQVLDLSTPGFQGSPDGLQSEVINPLTNLPAGEHTLAVFLCSNNNSSADQFLAMEILADDAGINAEAMNVVRNPAGTPANPIDDTFEFDVMVTRGGDPEGNWTSNSSQHPTGYYGITYHFSGFPATGPASVSFVDANNPALSMVLTVQPPPPLLWLGRTKFNTGENLIFASPESSPAWVQSGAESAQMNNTGTPQILSTPEISVPSTGASFGAFLEFQDSSAADNFEANDTLSAKLILTGFLGTTEVNLLPSSLDINGDGLLNGYSGVSPDSHLRDDEFNLAARPQSAAWTEACFLSQAIPAGTYSARLVVTAVNNHPTEIFRLKYVEFASAGKVFDRDRDGIADAEELAAGTDPDSPASAFKPVHTLTGSTLDVSFPTVPNRSYRILSSADLTNWTTEISPVITGDGQPRFYSLAASGRKKFVKVQVGRGTQPFP